MIKDNYKRQQQFLFLLIGSGIVLLLLANTLGWIYLQRIKDFFISDLKFRLENIVDISAKLIDANDLSDIIPGNSIDPRIVYYQNLLFEIKENNDLQNIYIISPTSEVLIDLQSETPIFDARQLLEKELLQTALDGRTTTGDLQELGEHKFLTAVTPLIDSNNLPTGILVIEARADFFDLLDQFDRGLILFGLINTILIIVVAFFLFRSIKRILVLQDHIRNQEHLVQLGEMAASVAHELRNPFGIIKGANSLIQKKYGQNRDEIFGYIPAELERLNKLIDDFLAFARTKTLSMQRINLIEMIRKISLGFEQEYDLSIKISIPDRFPDISADPDLLEQVLLNIIRNAGQASAKSGIIQISAEYSRKHALIHIRDKGTGILPEHQHKVFDPFFSTKDEGSGLGLAISRRLIQQMKGDIVIKSKPGEGTTVTIEIPI